MSYYTQSIPPVRDQRLTIGDSFAGCGCDLLDCAKSGCLLQKNRRFWQAGSCQMALTLMMAATVENAVIIMHGPVGCGSQLHSLTPPTNKGKAARGKAPRAFPWLSTNLREADVIGGGERKLRETIAYADRRFRPEIIFVVSTCAPNIIGDDVEEVVRSMQPEVTAYIASIHCPGFKTRVVASAYDSFYHGLLSHIPFTPEPWRDFVPFAAGDPNVELARKKYEYRKSRTINLFNATSIGPVDEREMERLLDALGLTVRVYTEYSSLDEFRLMSEAALNVSLCNVHDDYLLSYLKEKFDISYVIAGMPIGTQGTREWLVSVAAHFGLEEQAHRLCDDEEKQLEKALDPLLPELRGKRTLLCGGVIRVGQEALTLQSLGMEILAVRAYHYDTGAEPVYDALAAEMPEVPIAISNQLFEQVNQVRRYRPDIVISHAGTQGWLAKMGVPSIQLFNVDKPYFGYTGLYSLAKRLLFALKNPSYQQRLAEHIRLPYKESWYDREPFHYIKGL